MANFDISLIVGGAAICLLFLGQVFSMKTARTLATLNREQREEDRAARFVLATKTDAATAQVQENLFLTKTVHSLVNSNLTRVTERLLAALVAQRLLLENAAFNDMPNMIKAMQNLDEEILALRIELGERVETSKRIEIERSLGSSISGPGV